MKSKLFIYFLSVCFSENLCFSRSGISDEDYYKLPELFVLENYEKCLSQRDTVYCVGTFDLQAPQPSSVYDTLKKLSEDTIINFNHTRLYRGKCLGSIGTCPINKTLPLEKSFENCIDQDIKKEFGLRAHLSEFNYCKNREEKRKMDIIDRLFIGYISAIAFLNLMGTAYDIFRKDSRSEDSSWLMAFSLCENWKKLTNKVGAPGETFLCFHGMRAILTVLVHIAHTILGLVIGFVPNPRYVETIGNRPEFIIFFNGTLVIQTFIVITSFLRTLKTFGQAEKASLGYKSVIKAVIERYVRISPAFITAVGLSATLVPHLSDGPLWIKHVDGEAEVCRLTFWRQLFLLQNFYPPSCHPQAWYLSVDFQVYLITTIITIYLVKRKDEISRVLITFLAASLILVFTIVYFLELKPSLQIMSPENLLTSFKFEKSFHLLYQSIWGNLPSAIIGIMSACLYMQMKKTNYDLKKNKIFLLAFRMSIPLAFAYSFMGILLVFAMTSHLTVSIYATIDKPTYAIIMGVFILGCIFKVEVGRWMRRVSFDIYFLSSLMSYDRIPIYPALQKNNNTT
ncbi:nose resistant to fluoxetine protein 6-like isoform X2 [Choristoneura fumiferana]|uniref:nose resistant to fluoxetine protein 6-like isoform X2 n=1 Tax=Choristoneura fumiferana TaxID=7141 RepID=UPI003D15B23A